MKLYKQIRRFIRQWFECRTKRCSYYEHYLAYGPADLTHDGFHAAERLGEMHFRSCSYNGPNLCRVCTNFETRLRA